MPNSSSFFEVFTVDPNKAYSSESLGTKEKFWIVHPQLGQCLVKYPRPRTGEDWSEKVAAEIAEVVGLPHASYELAISVDRAASLSRNFVPPNAALIHGNELLRETLPGYIDETVSKFRASRYTIGIVLAVLQDSTIRPPVGWQPLEGITRAVEVFVGYLMLDAWIGNTDRHHENWGLVYFRDAHDALSVHLAPTFDHATSPGCQKARSPFYLSPVDRTRLGTHDAFRQAALRYRDAARVWLARLHSVEDSLIAKIVEKVPSDRITPVSRKFAQEVLCENRFRLLRLMDELR